MSNYYVLDASAILALLNDESGADRVQSVLENATCFMSVVNWSEVARKLVTKGHAVEPVAESLEAVGLEFKSFDYSLAIATAQIEAPPLSLGDRACLSLAATLGAIALSADQIWLTFNTGVNELRTSATLRCAFLSLHRGKLLESSAARRCGG